MLKSTKFPIAKLQNHPQQATIFGDVSDTELNALVELMRNEKVPHPIEILPDGMIVCGHQRVRAAKKLGWKEIDVFILADLADAGPNAVEKHFIEDNLVRRQLSPLGRVRCIKRLFELELGNELAKEGCAMREKLKQKLAKSLSCSSQTVNRNLRVLNTPSEVQIAFDRGRLDLITTGRISFLPPDLQCEIAERIRAGEIPKTVAKEYVAKRELKSWRPGFALSIFVRAVLRGKAELDGGPLDEVRPFVSRYLPHLQAVQKVIDDLIVNAQVEDGHGSSTILTVVELADEINKSLVQSAAEQKTPAAHPRPSRAVSPKKKVKRAKKVFSEDDIFGIDD